MIDFHSKLGFWDHQPKRLKYFIWYLDKPHRQADEKGDNLQNAFVINFWEHKKWGKISKYRDCQYYDRKEDRNYSTKFHIDDLRYRFDGSFWI